MKSEGEQKCSSSDSASPLPPVSLDRSRRQSSPTSVSGVYDKLDGKLHFVSATEAVSDVVVAEIFKAGLEVARAASATKSNPERLQKLVDENERIVDRRFVEEENQDENGNKDDREARSSPLKEVHDGRSNEKDAPADSDSSKELKSSRVDEYFFYTDFEKDGNESDTSSVIDTVEYYTRSISGLSFLSDIGFEDPGDKEVVDIEEKVIEEYGMDYVKKYEKKMGDLSDSFTKSFDKSYDRTRSYDRSYDKTGSYDKPYDRTRSYRSYKSLLTRESSVNPNSAITSTEEIRDDIFDAEREGNEVANDKKKKESSLRALKRSLKSLGRIRISSINRASRKTRKFGGEKEPKIQEPQDALATRAAAVALANSLILGDIRHEDDDVNAMVRNSLGIAGTNTVAKDQGTRKGDSRHLIERSQSYSHADTDDVPAENFNPKPNEKIITSIEKLSSYSYADTDEVPTETPTESANPQWYEKITMLIDTTQPHTESFVQDPDNQETVLYSDSISENVGDHDSNSSETLGDQASYDDWIDIAQPKEQVACDSFSENPTLPVEASDNREKEPTKNIGNDLNELESESQHEELDSEVTHNPNGPLIRLPSYHRNSSFRSGKTMGSSLYYNNKEVVYDPAAFGKAPSSMHSLSSLYNDNMEVVYDPTAFGKAPSSLHSRDGRSENNLQEMMKNHNSCCDLRLIANTLRTRNHQISRKHSMKHSMTSPSDSQWEIIGDAEHPIWTPSHINHLSSSPAEFEGVELQLSFESLNTKKTMKRHRRLLKQDKNQKKNESFALNTSNKNTTKDTRRRSNGQQGKQKSNERTEFSADEPNRRTSRSSRRRHFDPDRLLCSFKPSQSRTKDDHSEATVKRSSKGAKQTSYKKREKRSIQSLNREVKFISIGEKGIEHSLEEEDLCEKENANNVSMETAATVLTADDEDECSNFRIEVSDLSPISLNDPRISALLKKTKTSPGGSHGTSNIDGVKNCKSVKSKDERTKINVTTQNEEKDAAYLPQTAEDIPTISSPVPESLEAKAKYGGELVDLLQTISSYVDGIVEKNSYSIALPSTSARAGAESNKDGKENVSESNNLKAEDMSFAKNSIVSETSGATPSKASMLDAIYVPTNRTPDNSERCRTIATDDAGTEEGTIDISSLFDISLTYSESSHSGRSQKSEGRPNPPSRSLFDDDISDMSSGIVGSTTQPPQKEREERQMHWEGENPVVYHMSSSPPKPLYRAIQKRNTKKRPVERYSSSRLKTGTKDRSTLGSKAVAINMDGDLYLSGSRQHRAGSNPSSDANTTSSQLQRGNSSSRPPPPATTSRVNPPTYGDQCRPPTSIQEESTVTKPGLNRTDTNDGSANNSGSTQAVSQGGKKVKQEQKKSISQSNDFVVDENGFLIDKTTALLEDLDKSASLLKRSSDTADTELSRVASLSKSRDKSDLGKKKPFSVVEALRKDTSSPSRDNNGRLASKESVGEAPGAVASSELRANSCLAAKGVRPRRSVRFQDTVSSETHDRRKPVDTENKFAAPDPYRNTLAATDREMRAQYRPVHTLLNSRRRL